MTSPRLGGPVLPLLDAEATSCPESGRRASPARTCQPWLEAAWFQREPLILVRQEFVPTRDLVAVLALTLLPPSVVLSQSAGLLNALCARLVSHSQEQLSLQEVGQWRGAHWSHYTCFIKQVGGGGGHAAVGG